MVVEQHVLGIKKKLVDFKRIRKKRTEKPAVAVNRKI